MLSRRRFFSSLLLAFSLSAPSAFPQGAKAPDVVRLGNLKFAHYGAVSYMKEIGPKYGLDVKEQVFAKGIDIVPAIIAGDIDLAASALDGAIAGRAGGSPVYIIAGFAKGGVRIVAGKDSRLKSIADFKGKKIGVTRGSDDYKAAVGNAQITYDITAEHVQATTDLMLKSGVGKMTNPPPAKDYVKLDLLARAKQEMGIK